MQLALQLASQGRGCVEPNPMVGAVLVRFTDDGPVELARGWHRRFGGPHAEAECLAAARAGGADPRGAVMYVTLEPCFAFPGKKTPPCSEALISAGLGRVVVAMTDPDHNVAGRGIDALRRAGITVDVGICQAQAAQLLAPYIKLRTQGRPWVTCKWAQTQDGYLALHAGSGGTTPRWITGAESRAKVHAVRGLCDGICVGIGTVLADDPLLNNRSRSGKQPLRLVLDAGLNTPPTCQLVQTAKQWPLVIATTPEAIAAKPQAAEALRRSGAELLPLPPASETGAVDFGGVSLPALLDELGKRQHTHLLVEGGAKVLESFVGNGLADELLVFIGPQTVGSADLPRFEIARVLACTPMSLQEECHFAADVMRRYIRSPEIE